MTADDRSIKFITVYEGVAADGTPGQRSWRARVEPSSWRSKGLAIADIDPTSPGAEIILPTQSGLHVFASVEPDADLEGTLLWHQPTIMGISAAAIGNMDADLAPEIVIDGGNTLYLVEGDGAITAQIVVETALGQAVNSVAPPLLADVTGDGRLDVLVTSAAHLHLYTYDPTTQQFAQAWVYQGSRGAYGAPAIADVVPEQPGPEIAIGWDGRVDLIGADGAHIWTYTTATRGTHPSSISIGDTDGDGHPEIVFYMKVTVDGTTGRAFVLNHDGSLLWEAPAPDRSNSSAGIAIGDLDGDGTWEVVWNGENGLRIFAGDTGTVRFRTTETRSGTDWEHPVIADVDQDGHAEIVLASNWGLYVVGHDAVWGHPARSSTSSTITSPTSTTT